MLQSNTDAGSFKLQPAPRPKSKKRPQNPPRVAAANTTTSAADTGSVRSCFEDDDDDEQAASTPKATLFNVPLLGSDQHRVAEHDLVSPMVASRRHRSSTVSMSSNSSRASSSVQRLLSAMSIPTSPITRRPLSTASSPSATVHVMLTNKSPTPSSPLFPRRTLMRSFSSTCVGAASRSPTSPQSSPRTTLRKRMGWRGSQSARVQDELAILMSPGSPLTPRRADALHTPTQASIDSVLHLAVDEPEMEPLSATLKALGAKRRTERYASSCVLAVPASPLPDFDVKSPVSGVAEQFQLMTATRKIFHLPTWVRFEANHHARSKVVKENRQVVQDLAASLRPCHTIDGEKSPVLVAEEQTGAVLPRTSQLGDTAPSSPNGRLLAGFEVELPATTEEEEEEEGYVVNVVRRPTMATLRGAAVDTRPCTNAKSEAGNGGFVGAFRSALPGLRPQRRIKGMLPAIATTRVDADRRDGWGGVMTRSSWFPSQTVKGPLVSPARGGLKEMILRPSAAQKVLSEQDEGEEWEDVIEPTPRTASTTPMAERSFLELHAEPRFNITPTIRGWFPFRTHHPAASAGREEIPLDTWHTRPLHPRKPSTPTVVASHLITKGDQSVENRPLRPKWKRWTGSQIVMLVIGAVCVAAVLANVVILSRARGAPSSARVEGNGTRSYDPLVGNVAGLKFGPSPSTSMAEASQSSIVAKAAQMSHP